MERIVLKHLSGSKANQVEEFPLQHVKELVLGRDPSATVKYDPDRDDLVGRQHARIAQDPNDPSQFIITDLNSRNGTFVNRQRLSGTTRVNPGDVVQLGPSGPEFIFDVEPRPANATKATRIAQTGPMAPTVGGAPATRTGPAGGMGGPPPTFPPTGQPPMGTAPSGGVGKATVERIVAANVQQAKKSQSRTYLAIIAVVIVLFAGILAVGGFFGYRYISSTKKDIAEQTNNQVEAVKKNLDDAKATEATTAGMKPPEIVKQYGGAVVKIDVAWKLVSQQGNGLVYHQYMMIGGQPRACYVKVSDGSIEPYLTYNSNPLNVGIGGRHTGSGFAVSSDGFILTNAHVAAAWESNYEFPPSANNGVLIGQGPDGRAAIVGVVPEAPRTWVPAHSKQDNMSYDGRNDHLDVLFPNSERRLTAKLSSTSPRHDVALIKVDSPGTVPAVEINDNYDTIQAGDSATVLGYPAISKAVYGIVHSQDALKPFDTTAVEIPDPTVTVGNVGRVYRSQENNNNGVEKQTVSVIGDSYQLQINTTGPGNSGGPVFDDHGRVIGIFYAGLSEGSTAVTFAVPIRYGKELMGK